MIPDYFRDPMEGQMLPSERRLLFACVVKARPETVFEVGTWKGGGSTYIIACALHAIGQGKLYSCECDKEFFDHARALYGPGGELARLAPWVDLIFGRAPGALPEGPIDFLLLDGVSDPEGNLAQYEALVPRVRPGGTVAFHDWGGPKTSLTGPRAEKELWPIRRVASLAVFTQPKKEEA